MRAAHHPGTGDRHPGSDRREDTGNADVFQNQVRRKRQQEQQDDLLGRLVTAPAAEEAQGAPVQPTDDKPARMPIATLKNLRHQR